MICGRYAPSPTGRLHLGNLRTALLAWLQARLSNGRFILRIDDLDKPRNHRGSLAQIIADLYWIGLDWDEGPDMDGPNAPYLQSLRVDHYQKYFQQLQNLNRVYPCICSRKDVAQALSAPHFDQGVSVYPGTCRPKPSQENSTSSLLTLRGSVQNKGDYAWRFAVEKQTLSFNDQVLGQHHRILDRDIGDFVVKRRDGLFAYQLASAVDDGVMAVTDVVRGADLLESTVRQLAILDRLALSRPQFWHVPILYDEAGDRMAKRNGADSLEQWQESDKSPQELIGFFAYSLGFIDIASPLSCQELLSHLNQKTFRNKLVAYCERFFGKLT